MISGTKKLQRALVMELPKGVYIMAHARGEDRVGFFTVHRQFQTGTRLHLGADGAWHLEPFVWEKSSMETIVATLVSHLNQNVNPGACSVAWAFGRDMILKDTPQGYALTSTHLYVYDFVSKKWGTGSGRPAKTIEAGWKVALAQEEAEQWP